MRALFIYLICCTLLVLQLIKYLTILRLLSLMIFNIIHLLRKETQRVTYFKYLTNVWLYYFKSNYLSLNKFLLKLYSVPSLRSYITVLLKFKYNIIHYLNKFWKYIIRFDLVDSTEKISILRYLKLTCYVTYVIIYYIVYVTFYTLYGLYLATYYTLFAFYIAYRIILSLPRIVYETIKGLLFMSYKIIWYIISSLCYMFFNLFLDALYIIFHLPSILRKILHICSVVKAWISLRYNRLKAFLKIRVFFYLYKKFIIIQLNCIWGITQCINWLFNPNILGVKRLYYWCCLQYKLLKQPLLQYNIKSLYKIILQSFSLVFYNTSYNIYWFFWVSATVLIWFIFVFMLCVIAHSFYDYVVLNQYETDKKTRIIRLLCGVILYLFLIVILSILLQLVLGLFLAVNASN